MKRAWRESWRPVAGACLAALASAAAAQTLPDPTAPPATSVAGVAGMAGVVPAGPRLPVLQAILIDRAPGSRRLAVIDGVTVAQGGSVGGARVARIGANQVELVSGDHRLVLHLFARSAPDAAFSPIPLPR